MKQFGIEIKHFKDIENKFEQTSCPICFDDFDHLAKEHSEIGVLACSHVMHKQCLNKLVYKNFNKCPVCNNTLISLESMVNMI